VFPLRLSKKKPVDVLAEDRFDHGSLCVFKAKAYVLDVGFRRLIASDITERIKEEIVGRGVLPKDTPFFVASDLHGKRLLEKTLKLRPGKIFPFECSDSGD